MSRAYVFIGMPGAGKTTAATVAQNILDALFISTGDIVRMLASQHHGVAIEDLTGEQIGEFSTFKRETDSPLYVSNEVRATLYDDDRWPEKPLVLEGVRDSEALSNYRTFIDDLHVIHVDAPFRQRLERLALRGREADEKGYTPEDLMHREDRELDWGMDTLPNHADAVLMNTGDMNDLTANVFDTLDKVTA